MSIFYDKYLTINDFNNICRTCTSKNDLKQLHENENFIAMLHCCTMIHFDENDNLPKQICQTCITDLNHAYEFTNKCKAIDTALRKYLTEYDGETLSHINAENNSLEIDDNKVFDETKSNIEVRNDENKTLDPNVDSVYVSIKDEPDDLDYDECDNERNVDNLENGNFTFTLTAEEFCKMQDETNGDTYIKQEVSMLMPKSDNRVERKRRLANDRKKRWKDRQPQETLDRIREANRKGMKAARSQETEAQAAARREANRLRMAAARNQENDTQTAARRDANLQRMLTVQRKETAEQTAARREANRRRMAEARSRETVTQTAARREADRRRRNERYARDRFRKACEAAQKNETSVFETCEAIDVDSHFNLSLHFLADAPSDEIIK